MTMFNQGSDDVDNSSRVRTQDSDSQFLHVGYNLYMKTMKHGSIFNKTLSDRTLSKKPLSNAALGEAKYMYLFFFLDCVSLSIISIALCFVKIKTKNCKSGRFRSIGLGSDHSAMKPSVYETI